MPAHRLFLLPRPSHRILFFACGFRAIFAHRPAGQLRSFPCSLKVLNSPPGTQGAVSDVAKAYRTIPVLPEHKRLIVFSHHNLFFIDHCLPFGLSTAAGMQGKVADAMIAILRAHGIPSIKWIDDNVHIREPIQRRPDGVFEYAYDLAGIHAFLEPLGIPWQPDKCCDFADVVQYVGFLWDFKDKRVSLPEKKRVKHVAKIQLFLDQRRNTRLEAESLAGSLIHLAFVLRAGRSYLAGLFRFIASFKNNFQVREPPHSVTSDMRWWRDALSMPVIARSLELRGAPLDLDLWVDASEEWGIGLTWGHEFDAWRLCEGWKTDSRDIGWAEAVALELALLAVIERGYRDVDVIVRGDNTGARGALLKGRGRNPHTNLCVRRIERWSQRFGIEVVPVYVPSADNKADAPSRGDFANAGSQRAFFSFELPDELLPFLEHLP